MYTAEYKNGEFILSESFPCGGGWTIKSNKIDNKFNLCCIDENDNSFHTDYADIHSALEQVTERY